MADFSELLERCRRESPASADLLLHLNGQIESIRRDLHPLIRHTLQAVAELRESIRKGDELMKKDDDPFGLFG